MWTGAGHEGVTLMGPSATHGVYWENQRRRTWSIQGYGAREKGVIIASLFVTICEITEIPAWHMALASKATASVTWTSPLYSVSISFEISGIYCTQMHKTD